MNLSIYCDASFANLENYRSLSGHLGLLDETPIIWKSARQPVVAKSTQEAEYLALTPAMQDLIWTQGILEDIGFPQSEVPIFEDNEACIALANNPQSTRRSRHIQQVYHWIREHLENKSVTLKSIKTTDQLADLMTKGLYGPALRTVCAKLNLKKGDLKQKDK